MFGKQSPILDECKEVIGRIKNNDPSQTDFSPNSNDMNHLKLLGAMGWKLLGKCIAGNEHLLKLSLSRGAMGVLRDPLVVRASNGISADGGSGPLS